MHKGNNNSGIFASFVIVKTQIVNKMMNKKLLLQALFKFLMGVLLVGVIASA